MAAVTWEDYLPPIQLDFSYRKESNVVYTQMDSGPPKARRIDRNPLWLLDGKVLCREEEQVQNFWIFHGEIADGALPFNMKDPNDGEPGEWLLTRAEQVPLLTKKDAPRRGKVIMAEFLVTMTKLPSRLQLGSINAP